MQNKIEGTAAAAEQDKTTNHRLLLCPPHRQVLSRTFFSLLTIYLVVWIVFGGTSGLHAGLSTDGAPAVISLLVLLGAGLAAFLDVVLNDVLPSRFSFYLNRTHRHVVWGTIAVTYMGYAQVISKTPYGLFGVGFYGLLGLWAAVIAAMDVWYEYNEIERTKRNAAE